ncbi:hypothetical protein E2C01_071977 [Portunus trituberculatus]|uniref:Uncharacterized protein n=1 Tax=Portunus trituberculatus TaxID=210409 RepID=A0A5B7HYH0_PORTR|nr:hypothetical protein [Portunus trituberculatus]
MQDYIKIFLKSSFMGFHNNNKGTQRGALQHGSLQNSHPLERCWGIKLKSIWLKVQFPPAPRGRRFKEVLPTLCWLREEFISAPRPSDP